MTEILKAIRVVGLRRLLNLGKGYRVGWEQLLRGSFAMRTMEALLNVGFFDEMLKKRSVNPREFAQSRNLEPDILNALCEALYSDRILQRSNGSYSLDENGKLILGFWRGWLEVHYGYEQIWEQLEALLKKEKVYGKDFYRRSDYVASGSGEMEKWLFFPLANEAIVRKGFKKVLDLGCGDGTFLRGLCEMNRELTCFGIDLAPSAIELGDRRSRDAGVQERIHLLAADISTISEVPEMFRQVEVATIFFVLHELMYVGEHLVIQFLKDYRRLFPKAPLMAFEAIRPTPEEMRQRPGVSIYYFLYHDLSHQKPVGREKWIEVFKAAGFTSIEERYLGFARTAIYTVA
jgi:cyclopropane fatty-acyl-phospholipid synthase-like methyltransferase